MTASINTICVSALLVGEFANDRLLLRDVFRKPGWRLFEARGRHQALKCLKGNSVQVVLTRAETPKWSWKAILNDLRSLVPQPQLIVASRTADDHLWSEVLNFGAYDVLALPFDRDEVERVVTSARRHFDFHPERVRTMAMAAADIA